MKKRSIILILILILLIVSIAYRIKTPSELTVQDTYFAKIGPRGEFIPVENIFKEGENVNFILYNVGKFKKGEDGLHSYDMDIEIKDSNGNIILLQKELLGEEEGHISLPEDIASLHSFFIANLPPGEYKISLTAYDKINGKSITKSQTFTVITS